MGVKDGQPLPFELRARAVALFEQGNTQTETAQRLCVSINPSMTWCGSSARTGRFCQSRRAIPDRFTPEERANHFKKR